MVKIELRQDGWFEAGKDKENVPPIAHMIYLKKQEIKRQLTELSEQDLDMASFQKALGGIEAEREFKGHPYISGGTRLMIDTHGLPGECYLGNIK